MDNQKFGTLMYFLTKNAARDSFVDFLDYICVTEEEYDEIKSYLEKTYNIKLYV